jgi:hypothetical protein
VTGVACPLLRNQWLEVANMPTMSVTPQPADAAHRTEVEQYVRLAGVDSSHHRIHDPNNLIAAGYPAELAVRLVQHFKSIPGEYLYHHRGQIVADLIGVHNSALLRQIAQVLDVDDADEGYVGAGFANEALAERIMAVVAATTRDDRELPITPNETIGTSAVTRPEIWLRKVKRLVTLFRFYAT